MIANECDALMGVCAIAISDCHTDPVSFIRKYGCQKTHSCFISLELTSFCVRSSKNHFKNTKILVKIRNDNTVLPTTMNIKQKTVLTVSIV